MFRTSLRRRLTRRAAVTGFAVVLAAAGIAGGATYAVAAAAPDLQLLAGPNADRSAAADLANRQLSGHVAIFLRATSDVAEVRFHIDDPTEIHPPLTTDRSAPFDLAGGTTGQAVLFDTATLSNGRHIVTVRVVRPNGGSRLINKTVTVTDTGGTPAPTQPAPSTPPTVPPTTAPSAPPTGTTPPPAGGFPNERTTGVPAGTALRPSGALRITTPGAVVDGLNIAGGVVVEAAGVTIKRSRISGGMYAVHVRSGTVVVEDSEITGSQRAAVCCGNFVLRRVNIHHVTEGPRMNGNATVENSYIHHLVRCEGCHIDALQSTGGSGIRIRGNNIQVYNPDIRDPHNAAFMFGEENAPLRDCLVEGNLMNGGNFTVNGGGGGTQGAQCTFRANRFGRDFRYGPVGNIFGGVRWEASNVWADTGQPVR